MTDTAGSVESVDVGGVSMKGSTLRSVLGLRSACFEWEAADGKLVFFVTGYGHGVGMSQYGANQMAKEGADYRTILTHYYTGVTVEPILLPPWGDSLQKSRKCGKIQSSRGASAEGRT